MTILKRVFIGREDLIQNFKTQCENLREGESKIFYYTGVPGIGKTAFLKNLLEPANRISGVEYVYHDFDSIVIVKNVLKKLARRLSQAGFEFPLFEMGCYLYEKNTGENTFPPKQKSFLSDYPGVSNIVGLTSAAFTVAGTAGAIPIAFAAADFVQKNQSDIIAWLDKIYGWCVKNFELNDEKAAYRQYLRDTITLLKSNAENIQDENELEDKLIELFAQDLNYSTLKNNRRAVIILDSYEILILKGRKTKEHPEPDWWLKDEGVGLLQEIQNVIWVLGGRDKLNFSEDLNSKIIRQELKPFDDTVSLKFLQNRGLPTKQKILCYQITKLTRGYPLYLELCAEQYRLLKKKDKYHEPKISDFAPKNESFQNRVGKIVVNLIECMDDTGIREMIKYLCALKIWTDEIAFSIIPAFNETAYNMIKNFSFVRLIDKDDNSAEDNFKFDETVQEILILKYKQENKFVIRHTVNQANNYFKKFESANFSLWADIIVRLTDSAAELQRQYENNFSSASGVQNFLAEEIATSFFGKVKKICAPSDLPYAYFELVLAKIKNNQERHKEALELAESAHKKFLQLNAQDFIIEAMLVIAFTLRKLGDEQKSLEMYESAVTASEKFFYNDESKLIEPLKKLAGIVPSKTRKIELRERILGICKRVYGVESEESLDAMESLAFWNESLNSDRKINLLEKIIEIRQRKKDYQKLLSAMNFLNMEIGKLENPERKKILYQNLLKLYRDICGDDSLELAAPTFNLAITLEKLGMAEDALSTCKKIIPLYENNLQKKISIFGKNSRETLDAVENLLYCLNKINEYGENFNHPELNCNEKISYWENQKLEIMQGILENTPAESIDERLKLMEEIFDATDDEDKKLEIQTQRLQLIEEKINLFKKNSVDALRLIEMLENLASYYYDTDNYSKLFEVRREMFEIITKKLDENFELELAQKFSDMADATFIEFNFFGREIFDSTQRAEFLRKQSAVLEKMLEEKFDMGTVEKLIKSKQNLAQVLAKQENSEALKLNQEALDLSIKFFGAVADVTLHAMENSIYVLRNTGNVDKIPAQVNNFCKILESSRLENKEIVNKIFLASTLINIAEYDLAADLYLNTFKNYQDRNNTDGDIYCIMDDIKKLWKKLILVKKFDAAQSWSKSVLNKLKSLQDTAVAAEKNKWRQKIVEFEKTFSNPPKYKPVQ